MKEFTKDELSGFFSLPPFCATGTIFVNSAPSVTVIEEARVNLTTADGEERPEGHIPTTAE